KGIATIGKNAFGSLVNTTSVEIDGDFTTIGKDAFRNLTELKSATLMGVAYIGETAFFGCAPLEDVAFDTILRSIDDYSFENTALRRVVFESAPDFIGKCALGYVENNDTDQPLVNFTIVYPCSVDSAVFENYVKDQPFFNLEVAHDFRQSGISVGDVNEGLSAAIEYVCSGCGTESSDIVTCPTKFKLEKTSYVYTGKSFKPAVTVQDPAGVDIAKSNYTVKYTDNKNAGTAKAVITFKNMFKGTKTLTFKITKAANPMTAKGSTRTVKYATLKKHALTFAPLTVKKAQGTKVFKKTSGSKSITVNSKTGKFTFKKGTKKGTYTVKVKVTAKGNNNYKSSSKTVSVTIKVK
ncbi:MAG: leucine-rich repeat domain-containing protein, partial [Ruminococcus sp.]|nr:leucine-rich repeat domain-containing protein [Ruminococcus sp.]